jgi:hypothetical protein
MAINIDLNIINNDLSLDSALTPLQLTKVQVISQDIKHRILESGLLVRLVGLRNTNAIAMILTEIELVVEQDERITPGTIEVFRTELGKISVKAQTLNKGEYYAN